VYEYPIRAGVAIDPTIAGYGTLNATSCRSLDRRQPQDGRAARQ